MIGRRIQAEDTAEFGERGGMYFSRQFAAMMGIETGVDIVEQDTDPWFEDVFARVDRVESFPALLSNLRDCSILVVEDNADRRENLMKELLPCGVRVVAGTGVTAAFKALRSTCAVGDPLDIVIVDMRMPGVERAGLIARIKDDEQFRDVSVVMLTPAGLIFT